VAVIQRRRCEVGATPSKVIFSVLEKHLPRRKGTSLDPSSLDSGTVTLILRTMNRHARLMGWGDDWGEVWCLIKADQPGVFAKRCTEISSGAGQSTPACTQHHRRTIVSPRPRPPTCELSSLRMVNPSNA
jgi:hypothetical protein